MRIHATLVTALILIGLVPMGGFTWFTYKHMVERELDAVEDRHLLLAQNVSTALARYEEDVRTTVDAVATALRKRAEANPFEALMGALGIECVVSLDAVTYRAVSRAPHAAACGHAALWVKLARQVPERGYAFTTVLARPGRSNAMHLIGRSGPHIAVATVSTDYIRELAGRIAFGERGRAAVFDRQGRVLSHPMAGWVRNARSMAHTAPVRAAMEGRTGVERFQDAAMATQMIAGVTSVPRAGWTVMVSQPVSELHRRAIGNLLPLLLGLVVCSALAATLLYLSVRWLARPLEKLANELSRQGKAGMPSPVAPRTALTRIVELSRIVEAYNGLASTVARTAREMEERTLQDPVTGIGNRLYFEERAQAQIERRVASNKRGILFFCDLDGFKEINDTRGHALGDAVLAGFAREVYPAAKRYMDREFRGVPGDHPIVARIGGDEFVILLPVPGEGGEPIDMDAIGAALRRELPTRVRVEGAELGFGISAGGAVYPDDGVRVPDLLRRADVALYAAKAAGKGRFALYAADHALGGRSEILAAVTEAIHRDELVLEYQPKYSIAEACVTCVEALVRWDHPRIGRVSPGTFLPAIEGTGTMFALGRWVIERAVRDMKALDVRGERLDVAVNIAIDHFCADGFVEDLSRVCEREAFHPSRMQIEVTEEAMASAEDAFAARVAEVKAAGFSVALDDFGKGFSNIARMASIPADVVKLDRSLVGEAGSDERMRSVMRSAIALAHGLGSHVVVEGVETQEEVSVATDAGADALQGFYFSRSLPPEALEEWLRARRGSPQHTQLEVLAARITAA